MPLNWDSGQLGGGVTDPLPLVELDADTIFLDRANKDVKLYRGAANYLKTDDSIDVVGDVRLVSDGSKLYFDAAHSVDLYRSAADYLKTDDSLDIGTDLRLITDAGKIYLDAAQSVNLYRSAADHLKTDDSLVVGVDLELVNNSGKLLFGSSGDVNLYRSAANYLKTDDTLNAGADLWISTDTGKIYFGTNGDTNLYYGGAANHLKTDDSFVIVGDIESLSDTAKIYFGTAADVNLYRTGANILQTDDSFYAAGDIWLALDASKLYFDANWDVNLYASAPNVLKTDDSLVVGASAVVTTILGVGVAGAGFGSVLHISGVGFADGALTAQQIVQSSAAYNNSPTAGINFFNNYASDGSFAGMGGIEVGKENATDNDYASYMAFHTRANGGAITEQVRIDSGGDLWSAGYTDYSATSTIVGWSSFTIKKIFTKRIGKIGIAWFALSGTSNSTTTTFTVPFTIANPTGSLSPQIIIRVRDNSGSHAAGLAVCTAGSSTITLYKDPAAAAFTNGNAKEAYGFLVFQTA